MGALQSTEKKSPSKTVKEETKPSKPVGKEEKTPEKSGAGIPVVSVSPPKTSSIANNDPVDLTVSEEEMASVEAATTKIRDSVGGTSLEIVLSPAIKKVKLNFSNHFLSGFLLSQLNLPF